MLHPRIVFAFLVAFWPAPSAAQDKTEVPFQRFLGSIAPQLSPDQTYKDVVIVVFDSLSGTSRQEVEAVVRATDVDELRELQDTLGQIQQAVLMLAAAGMTPSQVIAAGVTPDGVLTLVVQETA